MEKQMHSDDLTYMKMAIEEAAKSRSEDDRVHPRVGVVIVKDSQVLARAHRGESTLGEHAEFTALEKKLSTDLLAGATVYTTLEPCTTRNHPKVPCAHRLIERRVRRVVIGMLDPNEQICGRGLWYLRESNIETDLFPHDLMSQIEELNREFIRSHRPKRRELAEFTDRPGAANPATPAETKAEDEEWELFSTLFDSMMRKDFDAAKTAYDKLHQKRPDEVAKQRLTLLYFQLRAIHARDSDARSAIEQSTTDPALGEYATSLLAELSRNEGNMDEAAALFQKAADTADSSDAKARLAIQAASVLAESNQSDSAATALHSVLHLSLAPKTRSRVLTALADLSKGQHADFVKAALLTRAAALDPTGDTMFSAAYALSKAGLSGVGALQYDLQLKVEPDGLGGLNNLGVALSKLGLKGMAVSRYKRAADLGNTLAMANLAQWFFGAGFFDEAEQLIKKGRMTDEPHENIGAAMVSLAQLRENEATRWDEVKKASHGHLRFINAFADAVAASVHPNPENLAGTWTIGTTTTFTLTVAGATVESTWEDGSKRRRVTADLIGSAIIGSMQEWSNLWDKYESQGILCMVQRDPSVLWGLLFSPNGDALPVEWKKAVQPVVAADSHHRGAERPPAALLAQDGCG